MNEQELLYTMALTRLPHINVQQQRLLLDELGSSQEIFAQRKEMKAILPHASKATLEALASMEQQLPRAEEELRFVQDGRIQCLCLADERYPARLRECVDAPVLLYYRGESDLNRRHVVSMVGTRRITEYGKDLCQNFAKELKQLCPDVLIVSGLAYGVDIHCHRAALGQEMDTVGVLAHGLDMIYPRLHRDTAVQMTRHGGLITEYMSRTVADKRNFVQRNRIVAGLADCVIVVESAVKGGSLITAEIANGYNREVFAFPGRVGDTYSAGCNHLIASNQASLVTTAQSFVDAMGWEAEPQRRDKLQQGIQQELFPELSEQETLIVNALRGSDGKQINILTVETALPVPQLVSLLFGLEMRGIVKLMAGGVYRLM